MAENNNIVSALNAGSGINIKELAQALVDAEKVPREALVQSKIDKSDAKISGLGIVKNVLERFKGAFQKLDSAKPILKNFLFLTLIPQQLIYLLHFLQALVVIQLKFNRWR